MTDHPLCNGKRRYMSQKDADDMMAFRWRKGRRCQLPVRSYKCPKCQGWHITKKSLWKKEA